MQHHQIILFLSVLAQLLLIIESFSLFKHHNESHSNQAASDECCVPSKFNVAAKKANEGRDFFRQLVTKPDSYKEINPKNMCDLIHFLIQEASLNNKSVTFTRGMFVIFDSTNQIFEKLMKAKDEQKSGDEAKNSGYIPRLKYMLHKAANKLFRKSNQTSDTFIYYRGDESSHFHSERGSVWDRTHDYPAYGMDISGACMPSGLGHILFGRLPSIKNAGKYSGVPIYIKPELYGIRKLKQYFQHTKSYLDHILTRYRCQSKTHRVKPDCSKEDEFRENTDKKLLTKWKNILLSIPSISNISHEYINKAIKYGLGEIYRQAKQIESTTNNDKVKDFLDKLVKQYGTNDLAVRKGREIIFTTAELMKSPLTCELFSSMKKC